jgi:hypothetical protein
MRNRGLLTSLVLLFLSCTSLLGQDDQNVSLTISLAGRRSQFHVGEVIPVELSFSAGIPDTYYLSTRSYDRSGRLEEDKFNVSPAGRDPLRPYFDSLFAIMGGGLSSGPGALSGSPQILREDLNEWVALDQPGHYSLYVVSSRVLRRGDQQNQSLQVRSNTVEFDIVAADPQWQAAKLASAVSVLNDPAATQETKQTAARDLRFLDSPASIRELVRLLGSSPDRNRWDLQAGLYGSRHQELVSKELETLIGVPDVAVSPEFVNLLARTKFFQAEGPRTPYPEHDEKQQATWHEREEARQQRFGAILDSVYDQAAAALSSKRGAARAETVRTLLYRSGPMGETPKPGVRLPESEIVSAFEAMPSDRQYDLLFASWERIRMPGMASALEELVERPHLDHQLLRDIALQRLQELDPVAARERILAEIRQPHIDGNMFTVKGKTLAVLLEKTLPQFDELLTTRLEQEDSLTRGLDAELIGRYATARILARVKAVYEPMPRVKEYRIPDGLNTYFLRVDPEYGLKHVTDAMSLCMENAFKAVNDMGRWADLEPVLIATMNGEDLNAARQAAEAIARYGDLNGQKAMWACLPSFHKQWADRQSELQNDLGRKDRKTTEAQSLQFGLVEALGRAQAWVLSDEQVQELENLTFGGERQNVSQWRWRSPIPLDIQWVFGTVRGEINNQYSTKGLTGLRNKLAQYPTGTRFLLTTNGSIESLRPALESIDQVSTDHGLLIERAPQPR